MASSSGFASSTFTAALSEDVKQRRALIPKIAKALSTWNEATRMKNSSSKHDNRLQGKGSIEWIEEKLWGSMTRALRLNGTSSAGVVSTWTPIPTATPTPTPSEPRALGCDDHDHDLLLTLGDSGRHVDVAAETNAAQHETKSFEHPHQQSQGCCIGVSSSPLALDDRDYSTNMHASAASLTHIDRKGEMNSLIGAPQKLIGQEELTHCQCSDPTFAHWHWHWHQLHEHADILEDVLISTDALPSNLPSRQNTAIEAFKIDADIVPLTKNTNITTCTSISTTFEENLTNNMDSPDSRQSLKEVLGDDMLLWSMWKRRPSTCPQGEDDTELLHNMFQNDPDMKLFSHAREEDMSYTDIMMLDSWDFSRKSSRSSTSSTPDSHSSSPFVQLEQISPYSYPSRVSSASSTTLASTRDSKEQRRHSSALKKTTKPSRMSEDDIVFQQTSPSRKVDIKTRKSVRDYSGRR